MSKQTITLQSPDGDTTPAEALVTTYSESARLMRQVGFIAGGFVGGAACIIIPILHFITTWGLPVLGIVAGLNAGKTRSRIREVEGACPACSEMVLLTGGAQKDEWPTEACPKCKQTLTMMLHTDLVDEKTT